MTFERVHRSRSQSPQSSWSTSQFAPRPFPVQEPKRTPTQEDIENEAFQQNKFEAFGLQLKEKHCTITPVEQERLGVLQAKMDSFWAQRMERSKAQPNLLEILIRNAQSTQAAKPTVPAQTNPIQAKGDRIGDPQESLVESQPNKTGLPDDLKAGVESLSGYSLDEVRVHYNSPKPAQLRALAYTQGTEIHVAPGQEKYLPHESWHIVQQAQGRVKPTIQLKDRVPVNDEEVLEHEADVMGIRALQVLHPNNAPPALSTEAALNVQGTGETGVVQRVFTTEPPDWKEKILAVSSQAAKLREIDAERNVNLDVFENDTLLGGASGMTMAEFSIKDGAPVDVRNSEELQGLSKDLLLKINGINIAVIIARNEGRHSNPNEIIPRDESGTIMSVNHEIERHALPFYDLYLKATMAAFNSDVLGDSAALNDLHARITDPSGEFTALAQHEDPTLSGNTAAAVIHHLQLYGNDDLNRRTLLRLALDTTKRGAGAAETIENVPETVKMLPLWNTFATLVVDVENAFLGSNVDHPQSGQRVLILDGAYMGMYGLISDVNLISDLEDNDNDFYVEIAEGKIVAYPKSWCLFLQ